MKHLLSGQDINYFDHSTEDNTVCFLHRNLALPIIYSNNISSLETKFPRPCRTDDNNNKPPLFFLPLVDRNKTLRAIILGYMNSVKCIWRVRSVRGPDAVARVFFKTRTNGFQESVFGNFFFLLHLFSYINMFFESLYF